MASKIGITKGDVDNIVRELSEEKENIEKYITKLDTELGNINDAWKGLDATKYTLKMRQDYKATLESYVTSYQSYIDFLSSVYDAYKNLDDKFAGEKIEV